MIETLPTTATEAPDELEDSYTAEDLEYIDAAVQGAERVLDSALRNGEPRRDVVETDRGRKGFVEAAVPGGHVEALFDGTGPDATPEEINIHLGSEDGEEHTIGVRFTESGGSLLFVDGEPARPEDVPSVAAVVEHILAEQSRSDDNEPELENDDTAEQEIDEVSEQLAGPELMSATLGDIDAQLAQAQEKLQSAEAELGDVGETLSKFFEELIAMVKMLEEELSSIANEKDEEKRKAMKRDLQRKINEVAARMASMN